MTLQSKLTRPLCCFDIEATGTDISKDRIVTIAIRKLHFSEVASAHDTDTAQAATYTFLCNPKMKMSDEVISIHGITNEMTARWATFADSADAIFSVIDGCDLAGFNLHNYDVPLLWEEFYRCGIEWNLEGIRILDAGNVFKKKEERTLSAAVQFYLQREHLAAHDALGDVEATLDVLNAQLATYRDLGDMSIDELDKFSRFDDRLDLAGKIVRGADGRPTYNIGKNRGVAVEDDTGFAQWMLNKDFSANTKMVVRKVLDEIYNSRQRASEDETGDELIFTYGVRDGDVPF